MRNKKIVKAVGANVPKDFNNKKGENNGKSHRHGKKY